MNAEAVIIPIESQVAGRFRFKKGVINPDGSETVTGKTGWFDNRILNNGLNQMGRTTEADLILACQAALDHYCKSSANSFVDSLAVAYSDKTTSVTVVKPLEYFRWTVESAFTDSQQIMSAFTAGRA